MSRQTWEQAVMTAEADGTALSNSTTPTSLLPTGARWLMPANFLDIGMVVRARALLRLSNIVTTPGTLTLDLRLGGTVVFSGGAMQLSTTAHTNVPLRWEADLTVRAIGSAANLMGQGVALAQAISATAVADSTTSHNMLMTPNTAPVVGANFDSTASQQWDLFGTFSIANAGNAVTLHQFALEVLN